MGDIRTDSDITNLDKDLATSPTYKKEKKHYHKNQFEEWNWLAYDFLGKWRFLFCIVFPTENNPVQEYVILIQQ